MQMYSLTYYVVPIMCKDVFDVQVSTTHAPLHSQVHDAIVQYIASVLLQVAS